VFLSIANGIWRPFSDWFVRYFGFPRKPNVVISVASSRENPQPEWLEWIYLKVEDVGHRRARPQSVRPAWNAWAWVHVSGLTFNLLWESPDGTQHEVRDILRERPEFIPFVRRAPIASPRGDKDVCYLTDAQWFGHDGRRNILSEGKHRLVVTIQFEPTNRVTRSFVLTVPPPGP
jgi:hypothetical protein